MEYRGADLTVDVRYFPGGGTMSITRLAQDLPVALLLLASGVAWSQTTAFLPLTDDAWVKQSEPDRNNGNHPRMSIGAGPKDGLVRFDAASIAGQTIAQATLKLFLADLPSPGPLKVAAADTGWNEDTVTWATGPNQGIPISVPITSSDVGFYVSIDVTTTVQEWADGTRPDAGFRLSTDGFTPLIQLHSKETSGGNAPILEVVKGAPPAPGPGHRLLDLSDTPVVIDQAGTYFLDRNWDLDQPVVAGPVIDIQVSHVIIDLRGFSIEAGLTGLDAAIIHAAAAGGGATVVRNGALLARSGAALRGAAASLLNVRAVSSASRATINFQNQGSGTLIRGSQIVGPVLLGSDTAVDHSSFYCNNSLCVSAEEHLVFVDNVVFVEWSEGGDVPIIRPVAGLIFGDYGVVKDNRMTGVSDPDFMIGVAGNESVVSNNVFGLPMPGGYGLIVSGTRNIVRGNVAGFIRFEQDGNFYADNQGDIDLAGTVQIDGGGNWNWP